MKCIKNCRIVLTNEVLENKALIYDSQIREIVDECEIAGRTDLEVIDAGGLYVMPGFIDVHIHGYLGEDTSDGTMEGLEVMSNGIMKNGVTGWLPTTMTVSQAEIDTAFECIRQAMPKSKDWNGALVLGTHSEGPFINVNKKGAQKAECIQKANIDYIKNNADVIKIITMAPEMDDNFETIKAIKAETNVLVSMGHTDATYEQALASVEAGVGHVTHLFNAQSALTHRAPGVVGAALTAPVTTELIADTFHVNKNLFQLVYNLKGDKLVLITDCTRAGGMADGEYSLGGQKTIVKGIECRLEDGTIAGSVLRMNDGVRNFHQNTNLSIPETVRLATINPATAIGYGDTKGSIEVGKDADLIVADGDFRIYKTIIGGETKYEA
ncbi:MAG: N-acetylglucosamine-6-phosphate deacetylase [Clostridia bacterium]|nr:N-acetylglucosamine-6-phosphate deacetylase [Clostridia bacterium]